MRLQNFALPMGILFAFTCAQAGMAFRYSSDWGMWPLLLVFSLIVAAVYSMVFALIARRRQLPVSYSVALNMGLGVTLLVYSYLFYMYPADWGAVNAHVVQLTRFERMLHSNWTFFLLHVVFIGMHSVAIRLMRRDRRKSK